MLFIDFLLCSICWLFGCKQSARYYARRMAMRRGWLISSDSDPFGSFTVATYEVER